RDDACAPPKLTHARALTIVRTKCFGSAMRLRIAFRETSLFVPQRFDRIEVGCAIRWIQSEADADRGTDKKTGDRPAKGKDDVHPQPRGDQVARDNSKNDSEDSASFRDEYSFG